MNSRVKGFAAVIFICAAVCVGAHFLALTGQSFFNLPLRSNWYPAVADSVGDLSRMKYLFDRAYFAGDRMNLSVPFGGNEMFFVRRLRPKTIEFDLLSDSIGIEFDRDEQGYSGLVLSVDPALPCYWFKADEQGKFIESENINPVFGPERSARVHFRIAFRDEAADVYCRSFKVCRVPVTAVKKALVGFFGFYGTHTVVDNVRIEDADSGAVFEDNFRNNKVYQPLFIGLCGLFVLFGFAGFMLFPATRERTLVFCVFWACAAVFCAVQSLYFVDREKKQVIENPSFDIKSSLTSVFGTDKASGLSPAARFAARRWFDFEQERQRRLKLFDGELEEKERLKALKPNRLLKIMFVGTGREWTARFADEYFVAKTEKQLQTLLGDRVWVECIGIDDRDGDGAKTLFANYCSAVRATGLVDICVLNLGCGDVVFSVPDFGAGRFRVWLEKFLKFNRPKGILTVLSKEALCPEAMNRGHDLLFAQMDELGRKAEISVLSLSDFLAVSKQKDFLWWDAHRLRPVGQELAGTFFAQELGRIIEDLLHSSSVAGSQDKGKESFGHSGKEMPEVGLEPTQL